MNERSRERTLLIIRALGVSQSILGGVLAASAFADMFLTNDSSFATSYVKALLGGVFIGQGIKNARGK